MTVATKQKPTTIPCHDPPDVACDRCSLDMVAEAVQLLLGQHEGAAYEKWPHWAYVKLMAISTFLARRTA